MDGKCHKHEKRCIYRGILALFIAGLFDYLGFDSRWDHHPQSMTKGAGDLAPLENSS